MKISFKSAMGWILVVAEEDVARTELVGALRALDYEVNAGDSAEAAAMLGRPAAEIPVLVLIDASLPAGGARRLLARLRTRSSTRGIRVAVMAGGVIDENEMSRFGVAAVLRKPLAIERLVEVVGQLVGRFP